jgi:hypothetical protein
MSKGNGVWGIAAGAVAAMAAPVLWAQYAPSPTTYSVTQVQSMMGPPVTMQIYRDGSKVVMDMEHEGYRTRSLYDLEAHVNYTWDITTPANGCSSGNSSGDWGDPFSLSDVNDIVKSATRPPGSETVDGFATKVYEAVDPMSKYKVKAWREVKYGLVIKAEVTPPGGAATTIVETKQFSLAKPAASLFVMPATCAPPVHVPTAAERYAAETGDSGENFEDPSKGPGSPDSCTMVVRVVRAGIMGQVMEPVTKYQVALDLNIDFDHPPHHDIGVSSAGHPATFSGGGIREYTSQLQNGVLRVPNISTAFDMEFAFGDAGMSGGYFYRHCSGPETVFLYVLKNPDKISEGGDWMWVKSGKFATVPAH